MCIVNLGDVLTHANVNYEEVLIQYTFNNNLGHIILDNIHIKANVILKAYL
jgi:hypothetical protein